MRFWVCIVVYVFLTWYFDHIIAENKGKVFSKIFFLQLNYWRKALWGNARIQADSKLEVMAGGLVVQSIHKTYRQRGCCGFVSEEKKVLTEINLVAEPNEVFTLLGKNGAGKSTLINVLTASLVPDQGFAVINGKDMIEGFNKHQMKIGLCPQFDALWEELTVAEHVLLFCEMHSSLDPEGCLKKLEEVNLVEFRDTKVSLLSGGMKRRLSVILASLGSPEVVFFDEPTTGLDPVNRKFIWKMIAEIKKESIVFLTTHSMEEAEFLSDSVAVIKEGRIMISGTKEEVKSQLNKGYCFNLSYTLTSM